MQQYLIIATIR